MLNLFVSYFLQHNPTYTKFSGDPLILAKHTYLLASISLNAYNIV